VAHGQRLLVKAASVHRLPERVPGEPEARETLGDIGVIGVASVEAVAHGQRLLEVVLGTWDVAEPMQENSEVVH